MDLPFAKTVPKVMIAHPRPSVVLCPPHREFDLFMTISPSDNRSIGSALEI